MTAEAPAEPRLTHTDRLGATKVGERSWAFLVWAPLHSEVGVRTYADGQEATHPLRDCGNGYFAGDVADLGDAPDYRFVLPDGTALPDPASRWQPAGVQGPSRGFDPSGFAWTDGLFALPPLSETVIYELHVGTFTAEGTFDAAVARLDELVDLGVTAIEPMPIAAFPGRRNWGYDGVFPFAAQESYGGPEGFQRFVDGCHARGLAVFLDVVYNHLGPEGNVLASFGPYFTDVYATPWGAAVNVSEAGSDEVRRYFTENAVMWLRDFHVDGLRFDAIHGIVDPTASPFLRELVGTLGSLSNDLDRRLILVAESADNNPFVITPPLAGGMGFNAQWNDDFHHALHAMLTGERDGYYQDYGDLEDLVRSFNDGFALDGRYSGFRGRRHGMSSRAIPRDHFVVFAQNHDQIGNRAGAERLTSLVEPAAARLAAAAVLLSPFVPLLFMGEEYGEVAPFPYFVDHSDADLLDAVRRGRQEEFGRRADSFDPASEETFRRAVLDRSQRGTAAGESYLALYRGLIACRREHRVLSDPEPLLSDTVLSGSVIMVRRHSTTDMAFLALNFAGTESTVCADTSAPEWDRIVDSADPRLGGDGVGCPAELGAAEEFMLPGYGFCCYLARIDQ